MPKLAYRNKLPRPDDPELLESIYNDISQGIPLRYAAVRAGISEGTAYHWQTLGRAELDHVETEGLTNWNSVPLACFAQTVKEARANCFGDRLSRLDAAEGNNWQKHATVLERRYPKDFGRNVQIEATTTVTYVHQLDTDAAKAIAQNILMALSENDTGGSTDTPTPLLTEATTTPEPDSD